MCVIHVALCLIIYLCHLFVIADITPYIYILNSINLNVHVLSIQISSHISATYSYVFNMCYLFISWCIKVKVKVEVYSLVSRTKCHSPSFTQLPTGHRTCSFIYHLTPTPEGAYSSATSSTQNYSNTQAFTVQPGTHLQLLLGWESAHVGKVPCLGAQHQSIIHPTPGLNPQSLTRKLCTLPLSHSTPLGSICLWLSTIDCFQDWMYSAMTYFQEQCFIKTVNDNNNSNNNM